MTDNQNAPNVEQARVRGLVARRRDGLFPDWLPVKSVYRHTGKYGFSFLTRRETLNPVHDHICGWFLIGRGKACKWKHRYTPHAQANSVNRLFSSRLANVRALCRFFWTASRSHTRAPRQGFAWVGTCQQQWPRLDLGARRARLWSHSFRTDDEVRGKKPAKETLLFPPPAPNVRALFALPAVVL